MKILSEFEWWKGAVIYQIYPRSFNDANGDGVGDLAGIIDKLDYLQWLGINAIWISPIYPSPMADFGYDISDYCGIEPIFGGFTDFDKLLDMVHSRNMKLIMDLVPNHTSNEHPWFLSSRSSKSDPKRDWYIWKDAGADGRPPNNWRSVFGGSAWEWEEETGQFYYHGFLSAQPDLNWRNEQVQEAMLNVMQFWLDKGVDGFRVDVIWHMIKDDQFRNNPVNPEYEPNMPGYDELIPVFSTDQPEVHDVIRKMRSLLDRYSDRMMIGEVYLPLQKLMLYYGTDLQGAHMPFNFTLLNVPWKAQQIGLAIDQYEGALPAGGWPNWVLGNHDQHRVLSRIGKEQARVAAILLLTLRGTPTLYYGDEIAMTDVAVGFDEQQDPQGLNMPDKNLSRDPARTPMQWDDTAWSGFSAVRPWLPLAENYKENNVKSHIADPASLLNFYLKLINLRQHSLSLSFGQYVPVIASEQLLAYIRKAEKDSPYLVILNLSHMPAKFITQSEQFLGRIVFSTNPNLIGQRFNSIHLLGADEALIIKLKENK